jgi:hypothetical protein
MKLCTSTISIDIIWDHSNLPVLHDSYVSEKAKHGLGPLMRSGLCQTHLSAFDFFGEFDLVVSSIVTNSEQPFFTCFVCVSDSENKNLSSPQGIYFCGIGNLVSICFGSRNSCVSRHMRNLLANALFFLL